MAEGLAAWPKQLPPGSLLGGDGRQLPACWGQDRAGWCVQPVTKEQKEGDSCGFSKHLSFSRATVAPEPRWPRAGLAQRGEDVAPGTGQTAVSTPGQGFQFAFLGKATSQRTFKVAIPSSQAF